MNTKNKNSYLDFCSCHSAWECPKWIWCKHSSPSSSSTVLIYQLGAPLWPPRSRKKSHLSFSSMPYTSNPCLFDTQFRKCWVRTSAGLHQQALRNTTLPALLASLPAWLCPAWLVMVDNYINSWGVYIDHSKCKTLPNSCRGNTVENAFLLLSKWINISILSTVYLL